MLFKNPRKASTTSRLSKGSMVIPTDTACGLWGREPTTDPNSPLSTLSTTGSTPTRRGPSKAKRKYQLALRAKKCSTNEEVPRVSGHGMGALTCREEPVPLELLGLQVLQASNNVDGDASH